ncbi:glycoside hydrolase domain-containing protein [Cytobacillus gottheilii]|uniref:glycoside hydrolase domain-containing protein n=1 Tax=Cytobacillus gottheilii TaxID=859144 RepID=UPI002148DA96|nr:glycoside hydrolase domain-containing protein [Cytobacillus gottheilii]
MNRKKWLSYAITAFAAAVLSIFLFSFIDSKEVNPSGDTHANETEDANSSSGGESGVTNNVENDVNSDNADITNSINNQIKNGNNNSIDNNITNNINVNVDVNVQNDVTNNTDGASTNEDSSSDDNNEAGNDQNSSGENSDQSSDQNASGNGNESEEVVWGVDSASLTTNDLLSCVRENFGDPAIWGRYLGEKEGVSAGLTSEEVQLLQNEGIEILVIWNHFTDATGYENGQNEARQAIEEAQQLGIPEGVAIFADIEPNYPVDAEFIQGFYEGMSESSYVPGVYGVFDSEQALFTEYTAAAENNAELQNDLILWTASPQEGITTEENAPAYNPEAPEGSLVYGWQYGLDAQTCNIDTNLFRGELSDYLWS